MKYRAEKCIKCWVISSGLCAARRTKLATSLRPAALKKILPSPLSVTLYINACNSEAGWTTYAQVLFLYLLVRCHFWFATPALTLFKYFFTCLLDVSFHGGLIVVSSFHACMCISMNLSRYTCFVFPLFRALGGAQRESCLASARR